MKPVNLPLSTTKEQNNQRSKTKELLIATVKSNPVELREIDATRIQSQQGHLGPLHAYRAKTAISPGCASFSLDRFQGPAVQIEIYSLCRYLSTCNLPDLPRRFSSRRAGTKKIIWTNEWSLPLNSVKCRGLRWNARLKSRENVEAAFWKLCRWCHFRCKLVCGICWWILSMV